MRQLMCVLGLLVWSAPTWAFSSSFRVAGADTTGSTCSAVLQPYINASVMECTTTGGMVILHTTWPAEATTFTIQPQLNYTNPTNGATGKFCNQVCAWIVRNNLTTSGGGDLSIIPPSPSCTLVTNDTVAAQWHLIRDTFAGSITIGDNAGSACSTQTCGGGELYVQVIRQACSGNSTASEDFLSLVVNYQ